ncbi:uncharacterized protein KQ657_003291 [Scheffersomyces spartinae]|uniref:Uncharacterized protein n=1 Tax=Scheffersomyces spartinae TaxID=45513 RepID=A0A9P8AK67_9ASCO|nr:uncharacterized protein KQ657_003291 [Scheffersomyces spartinae]KAG7195528.1 hypothetical protein KQ657_003291 [Scheffersomyces spartinae]
MWTEQVGPESEGDLFVDCVTEDDMTFDTTIADEDSDGDIVNIVDLDRVKLNDDSQVSSRHSLLSILNGNLRPKPSKPEPPVIIEKAGLIQKRVSVMDILGPQSKSPQRMSDAEYIESKMYTTSIRRTTAKDLLSGRFKKSVEEIINVDDDVLAPDQDLGLDLDSSNEILESKIYKNTARSSAKDILKRQSTKQYQDSKSFMVCIKLPIRSKMVTLHINKDKLQALKKESRKKTDAFFQSMMKASKNSVVKTARNKSLQASSLPIITRDQFHVKPEEDDNEEAEERDSIHDIDLLRRIPKRHSCLSFERIVEQLRDAIEDPAKLFDSEETSMVKPAYTMKKIKKDHNSILALIESKIPQFQKKPQLRAIYDKFIAHGRRRPQNGELWINLFRPQQSLEVLVSDSCRKKVNLWLLNSFSKLRLQALKQPRNVLIKEKKRRQRLQQQNEFDSFIVDDSDISYTDHNGGNGSDTEEEIFVPILVLKGATGSCKSSSIYASMEEQGGYVFEVNSGQPRSRRDIWNILKEFATTQIVQKQNMFKLENIIVPTAAPESESGFQKGIILFEDVNILFEQDKTFWQLIQELLNISRRPIVLTCNSCENIPKSILDHIEDDSVLTLDQDESSKQLIREFIWLCCLSQGFNVQEEFLQDILKRASENEDQHVDLRSCLMECQFICQHYETLDEHEFLEIDKLSQGGGGFRVSGVVEDQSLGGLAKSLDMLSHGDVIFSNSHSLVNHDRIENEFLDLPVLNSANWLKQTTSIHELNIGEYMMENTLDFGPTKATKQANIQAKFLGNYLRQVLTDFLSSRSKRKYRITRSATPMDSVSSESVTSSLLLLERDRDPELECFIYKSVLDTLTLELLPYGRRWFYFQKKLNEIDTDNSIKAYLGYRLFHYESTDLMNTFRFSWSMSI